MPFDNKKFASWLKRTRRAQGSIRRLSDKGDVGFGTLQSYEAARWNRPTVTSLEQIATALGLELGYVLEQGGYDLGSTILQNGRPSGWDAKVFAQWVRARRGDLSVREMVRRSGDKNGDSRRSLWTAVEREKFGRPSVDTLNMIGRGFGMELGCILEKAGYDLGRQTERKATR